MFDDDGVPGCYKILSGCYKILPGCYKILSGSDKILSGCYKILPGCYKILSGCYKILSGSDEIARDDRFERPVGSPDATGGSEEPPVARFSKPIKAF